jgi:hypothetical protein
LAIQEYNFFYNYIKGELNIVADGLSRLTNEVPTTTENWSVLRLNETLQGVTEMEEIPMYETLGRVNEVEEIPSPNRFAASGELL